MLVLNSADSITLVINMEMLSQALLQTYESCVPTVLERLIERMRTEGFDSIRLGSARALQACWSLLR